MSEKIKLSFVNGGKEFILPSMTVERQEAYLDTLKKIDEEFKDEEKRARETSKQLILVTLKTIDSNVTMDNIKNMHPSDFVYLSNLIWEKGKELTAGEKKDFRKTK